MFSRFIFQEDVYYSEPAWEGGFLLEGREDKRLWTNANFDTPPTPERTDKNFWGREDGTKNTSFPREGGQVRGWEGVQRDGWEGRDCNGFQWSQENAEKGGEGNISWGTQGGGRPGNVDEEVMVHIIL